MGLISGRASTAFTTHGCIRLHPDDARSLSDVIWVGMPIRIVYQSVLLATTDPNHVMVEVHADVYRRAIAPEIEIAGRLRELNADIIDLTALNEIVRRKAGRGISLEHRARQPDPTSTW
jgi:L,D-transpeptidase ErfK/SrfK